MGVPEWFNEDWVSTDAKALGVYMSLLRLRFLLKDLLLYPEEYDLYNVNSESKLSVSGISSEISGDIYKTIKSVKEEIEITLAGKERDEALESARAFLENFFFREYWSYARLYALSGSSEEAQVDWGLEGARIIALLDYMEEKYYDKFRKACHKYFRKKALDSLDDARAEELLGCIHIRDRTPSGSLYITGFNFCILRMAVEKVTGRVIYDPGQLNFWFWKEVGKDKREEVERMTKEMWEKIYDPLVDSRILWFGAIIPAPFLEDEFIEKLAPWLARWRRTSEEDV